MIFNEFIINFQWFSMNFNQGVTQELIRNLIDFLWILSQNWVRISLQNRWFYYQISLILVHFVEFYYQILRSQPKSIIFIFVPLFINFLRILSGFGWKIADFIWILWPLRLNPLFQMWSTFRGLGLGFRNILSRIGLEKVLTHDLAKLLILSYFVENTNVIWIQSWMLV